jgi:hypothetical protein
MLRGGRPVDGGTTPESFRAPSRSGNEVLLAMVPLPSAPEFRISGWPQWLVPAHPGLSNAVRARSNDRDSS